MELQSMPENPEHYKVLFDYKTLENRITRKLRQMYTRTNGTLTDFEELFSECLVIAWGAIANYNDEKTTEGCKDIYDYVDLCVQRWYFKECKKFYENNRICKTLRFSEIEHATQKQGVELLHFEIEYNSPHTDEMHENAMNLEQRIKDDYAKIHAMPHGRKRTEQLRLFRNKYMRILDNESA